MFQFFRRSSLDAKRQKVEESPSRSAEDVDASSTKKNSESGDDEMEVEAKEAVEDHATPEETEMETAEVDAGLVLPDLAVSSVTSVSVTLQWKFNFDGDPGATGSEPFGPHLHFRVRYYRMQFKTDVWRYSDPVRSVSEVVIQDLEKATQYVFELQVARSDEESANQEEQKPVKASRLKWKSTPSVQATTWGSEKEERVGNLLRVHQFLIGNLEDYPEEQHVPDTYLDKAARSFEGILSVAGMVGAGGKWLKIARDGWKMRQYGLAALIFREDLTRIMVTLGTHVGRLAEEMGLSNKELILGSYYYFWERKRERLIYPGN